MLTILISWGRRHRELVIRLTQHYLNQGNRLYLKLTPSKTHSLILIACLGDTGSLFGPVTSWVDWQVLNET